MARIKLVENEAAAIDIIALAFAADPIARWVFPDPHVYLTTVPDFVGAFAGGAFAHGTAYCTEDSCGAALWLPPGVHSDEEALGALLEGAIPESRRGAVFEVFEQMGEYHPEEPHWYLPLIGVDPAHHGKGNGGALMAYALERCDRDGTPAYLESTNPRNISLYQRHGFEPICTIQRGSSPPMVPMLRKGR